MFLVQTMELFNIDFNYSIKERVFQYISFTFELTHYEKSSQNFVELAKSKLAELEKILDTHYAFPEGFVKAENGQVTANSIEAGFDYNHSNTASYERNGLVHSTVRYKLRIRGQEVAESVNFCLT